MMAEGESENQGSLCLVFSFFSIYLSFEKAKIETEKRRHERVNRHTY